MGQRTYPHKVGLDKTPFLGIMEGSLRLFFKAKCRRCRDFNKNHFRFPFYEIPTSVFLGVGPHLLCGQCLCSRRAQVQYRQRCSQAVCRIRYWTLRAFSPGENRKQVRALHRRFLYLLLHPDWVHLSCDDRFPEVEEDQHCPD